MIASRESQISPVRTSVPWGRWSRASGGGFSDCRLVGETGSFLLELPGKPRKVPFF